jgi:Ca-activated chloride channel family protein
MSRLSIFLLCVSIIAVLSSKAIAGSVSDLVEMGNESWIKGDYEEALKKYNEATVDDPESPYIYFNKGTAFYKKENYSDAIYAFEKAALKSKEPEMEAKSRFNLGNCAFREAERQMDSDIKKSLEYCEKSIKHYHDALKLDPELKEAAENIEIVRLVMKNILDEIKKQEQEAKEKEEAAKENAEKLRELIKRQEKSLEKNRQSSSGKPSAGEYRQRLNKLADEQQDITGDTREFAEKLKQGSARTNQGKEIPPAVKNIEYATREQFAAEENLRKSDSKGAEKNQENAVRALKEALKPPEQDQDKQGQQDQSEQQNQGGGDQQQSAENKPAEQDKAKEQAAMHKANEGADDILDEEKENKERRKLMSSGGYRDVDKDW